MGNSIQGRGGRSFVGTGYISLAVIIVYLLPVIFLMMSPQLGINYHITPNYHHTHSGVVEVHPITLILSGLSWGGLGVTIPAYIMGESLADQTEQLLQTIHNTTPHQSISPLGASLVTLPPISVTMSIMILIVEAVVVIILLYLAAWVGELVLSAAFKESAVVLGILILLSTLLPYFVKWIEITIKGG